MKSSTTLYFKSFTLIEVVISTLIFSIVSLMVIAPLLVSSRGIGTEGAAMGMQMASMSREYAETISSDLTNLSESDWAKDIARLSASSPVTITPNPILNKKSFRVSEVFVCVEKDLTTIDTSCSKGFAKIDITVTASDSGFAFALTFIKTRTGI